jgi:hypothetical protein
VAVSALCAVLIGQLAWRDPRLIVPCALVTLLTLLPGFLARRRMKTLLMSGDVKRVLGTWQGSIARVTHPETMAPLMAATAYAAYGWIEAARRALDVAVKGPAWDAALEQRLFVETLLDTFEGEGALSMQKADALVHLPVPPVGPFARARVSRLRNGIAAMARAFSHRAQKADEELLRTASAASPLIHWAMRYALAIVAVDRGDTTAAHKLIDGAPSWPEESAFRSFHRELEAQLSRVTPSPA